MKNIRKFRVLNAIENKIVVNSISEVFSEILQVLNKIKYELFISLNELSSEKKYPSIHLIPNNLKKIFDSIISPPEIDINSAGLYFGFIKRNKFFLSLEGTEFLHKLHPFSERYQIFVNDDGEKSILYGNKILRKMIIKIPSSLKKNDFLLVFNKSRELISIAKSQVNCFESQDLSPKDVIALNLVDKGYYLRKKQ